VKLILIHIVGKWSVLHLINGIPSYFYQRLWILFKEDAPYDGNSLIGPLKEGNVLFLTLLQCLLNPLAFADEQKLNNFS